MRTLACSSGTKKDGNRNSMLTPGINYSQMHDSSACIVRDDELLFPVAEERISRLRHCVGYPGIGSKEDSR